MTPGDPIGIDVQPRDIEVLRGLFESRVMTREHITALYFSAKVPMATKRLQVLKKAGLVGERTRKPYEPGVLFLTRKGFGLLGDGGHLSGYPNMSAARLDKRAQVSRLTLKHELEVMDVKTAIAGAIAKRTGSRIVDFCTWPALIEFSAFGIKGRRVVVKPDGFIRIHEEDPEGVSETALFLEVDRSTEAQSILADRACCYLDFYRRGGMALRNGRPVEEYRDHPFRVLYVLRNEERRNNTAEALLRLNPPILTQVWLSTKEEVTGDPLGAIWIRPGDYRTITAGTTFDPIHMRSSGYRRQSERERFVEERSLKLRLLA